LLLELQARLLRFRSDLGHRRVRHDVQRDVLDEGATVLAEDAVLKSAHQ